MGLRHGSGLGFWSREKNGNLCLAPILYKSSLVGSATSLQCAGRGSERSWEARNLAGYVGGPSSRSRTILNQGLNGLRKNSESWVKLAEKTPPGLKLRGGWAGLVRGLKPPPPSGGWKLSVAHNCLFLAHNSQWGIKKKGEAKARFQNTPYPSPTKIGGPRGFSSNHVDL
jgi:hypothetical protein